MGRVQFVVEVRDPLSEQLMTKVDLIPIERIVYYIQGLYKYYDYQRILEINMSVETRQEIYDIVFKQSHKSTKKINAFKHCLGFKQASKEGK
jgi:hypothetical protein